MKKVNKEFLVAMFILFAIPVGGYFVLKKATDDRMKVSASLQPKDSIALDVMVTYLDADARQQSIALVDMPYILKVIAPEEHTLELEQVEKIMEIINDRSDLAFLLKESPLRNTAQNRVMGYQADDDPLVGVGDVLLVDAFNRVLQIYDKEDAELYGKLLEDISFAFPMVDFRIDKLSVNAKPE